MFMKVLHNGKILQFYKKIIGGLHSNHNASQMWWVYPKCPMCLCKGNRDSGRSFYEMFFQAKQYINTDELKTNVHFLGCLFDISDHFELYITYI